VTQDVERGKIKIPRAPVVVQSPLLTPGKGARDSEAFKKWFEDFKRKLQFLTGVGSVSEARAMLKNLRKDLAVEREKLVNYSTVWQKPIALLEFLLDKSAANLNSLPESISVYKIREALKQDVDSFEEHLANQDKYNYVTVLESHMVGGYETPAVISVWKETSVMAQVSPEGKQRTKLKCDTRTSSRATMFSFILITPGYENEDTFRRLERAGAQRLNL
jgi:hypothetical protein